ncbi:hypothetical protein FAUST_10572 [Fusarium austroamericanum]|uniref:2EXR domain-containing protein n=1 Tax=Fusarium austroamericanum TaxID=282268 RepID=A0AAN6BVX8_FUSAU|nr:hypothetical protein FAUST_10572 [Fusarium austroamericanum]
MASSNFHPFPRLPLELRQQIWEEACLPMGPFQRGLQYLYPTADDPVTQPCNWLGASEHGLSNKSAYMIDGGLWKACKESRKVIAEHTDFKEWIKLNNEAIHDDDQFNRCKASWDGCKSTVHPAAIEMKEDNQKWHDLVYPARDIFCVRPNVEIPMPEKIQKLCLWLSFRDPENELYQSMPLDSIAFEFDQSWMEDCKMPYYDMQDEQSVRGCWASLIEDAIDIYDPSRTLWIIDKNAKWFNRYGNNDKTVYRKCEGDYIEASWDNVPESTGDGVSLSASAFLSSFSDRNGLLLCEIFAGPGSYYPCCAYE